MRSRFFASLWIGLVLYLFSVSASAQSSPLPLGTITNLTPVSQCPTGYLDGSNCFRAQVSCPNTLDLGFTFGYDNPAGPSNGTVVFLAGANGTNPEGAALALSLLTADYQVVQINWDTAWEYTANNFGNSIKTAACRPATFLNYIYQNLYSTGGMCASGTSAGAGAVAYALAWYDAADYLDNVELLSGPVFSDIEQGCEVPNAPPVNVCPVGQFGCNTGFLDGWQDAVQYLNAFAVGQWTGNESCNAGQRTTPAADRDWKSMSIVDGTSGPSFVYPQTNMAGWLCASSKRHTCSPGQCPNNSAAEGEIFFEQFTNGAQIASYSVNRIDQCDGAEGVTEGDTPQGVSGLTAIAEDMIAHCTKMH